MKKNIGIKFAAAATAAALIPFAVTQAINNPPDVSKIMAAAVNFTSNSSFFTENSEFGNGNLILYKPNPPQQTEETKAEAAEVTNAPDESASPDSSASENTVTEPETEITKEETNDSKSYLIAQNIYGDSEDLTLFDGKDYKVKKTTFPSNPSGFNFIDLPMGGRVRNCTELDNEFVKDESVISPEFKIERYSSEPQVLIMHTHTTESFLVGTGEYQDSDYTCRSKDPSQNVVAIGEKMAEKLAEKGICVLHDGTVHDQGDFNKAYAYSRETVSNLLSKYPSIKVVFDIHRDGIIENETTPVAAVTSINGKEAAQVMIMSGASNAELYNPNYLHNFHLACLIQQYMESENEGITRPVLFRYGSYNQYLSKGSLLLEVGSQGNTLEQVLYTGELIGDSIGNALLTLC